MYEEIESVIALILSVSNIISFISFFFLILVTTSTEDSLRLISRLLAAFPCHFAGDTEVKPYLFFAELDATH